MCSESSIPYAESRHNRSRAFGAWRNGHEKIHRRSVGHGKRRIPIGSFLRPMVCLMQSPAGKDQTVALGTQRVLALLSRLERGRFQWPQYAERPLQISRRQLQWLLDGLAIEQKQAHEPVHARIVV